MATAVVQRQLVNEGRRMRKAVRGLFAVALAVSAIGVFAPVAGAEDTPAGHSFVIGPDGLVGQCNGCFPGLPWHAAPVFAPGAGSGG
jgi:hypothetical protein